MGNTTGVLSKNEDKSEGNLLQKAKNHEVRPKIGEKSVKSLRNEAKIDQKHVKKAKVAEKQGYKRAALFYVNDAYGVGIKNVFKKFFKSRDQGYSEEIKKEITKTRQGEADTEEVNESKIKKTERLFNIDSNILTRFKQEVEKYNAVWNGWLYQIPEFRIKNIGKKKADLLKKDEKPIH